MNSCSSRGKKDVVRCFRRSRASVARPVRAKRVGDRRTSADGTQRLLSLVRCGREPSSGGESPAFCILVLSSGTSLWSPLDNLLSVSDCSENQVLHSRLRPSDCRGGPLQQRSPAMGHPSLQQSSGDDSGALTVPITGRFARILDRRDPTSNLKLFVAPQPTVIVVYSVASTSSGCRPSGRPG